MWRRAIDRRRRSFLCHVGDFELRILPANPETTESAKAVPEGPNRASKYKADQTLKATATQSIVQPAPRGGSKAKRG